ncbi:MAG: glycosyltransferase family 2 protein [Candidatus Shapirobacteria bacterium]|jgi:glycosyltransferase involved in cell wall biosynthesis
MKSIKRLSIVIPVYNEENTIEKIIKRVADVDLGEIKKEIIVVNDGSTDGTGDKLGKIIKSKKLPIVLVNHLKNQGKSMALRTGFKKMTGDVAVVQDGDLEYDPNDFKTMLAKMMENKVRVVYGSRQLGGRKNHYSGIGFYLGGQVLTLLTNLLYGGNITDEPTCYKMFETKLLKSIKLESKRFEFCPEVTAKILKSGEKIYEVPISYNPRNKQQGKKIKLKDFWEAVWMLVKNKINV